MSRDRTTGRPPGGANGAAVGAPRAHAGLGPRTRVGERLRLAPLAPQDSFAAVARLATCLRLASCRLRIPGARLALLATFASLLPAATALGHGLEPALLGLRETSAGVFEVVWKSASQRLPGADVRPTLPANCRPSSPIEVEDGGDRVRLRWTVDCGPGGLDGREVGVSDLDVAKITALVRVRRLDGATSQVVLNETQPAWVVPARASPTAAAASFLRLGLRHVLSGTDHVLLVALLLLLAGSSREMLALFAAFALGEGLALGPAILGAGHLQARVASLLLAACLLALATLVARRERRPHPSGAIAWVPALLAGLVQGAGFAGALGASGLPLAEAPAGWLGFEVGLLLAQALVAALLLGLRLFFAEPLSRLPSARAAAILASGALAAFWCFERVAPWVG